MTLEEDNEIVYAGVKKYRLYIAFAGVVVGLFCFYGLDEEDAKKNRFFTEDDPVTAQYKVILDNKAYHLGEMVSHLAKIALLSVIGILFVWIIHVGIEGYLEQKKSRLAQ